MKYVIITICLLIIIFSVFYVIRQVIRNLKSDGCSGNCSTCSMQGCHKSTKTSKNKQN